MKYSHLCESGVIRWEGGGDVEMMLEYQGLWGLEGLWGLICVFFIFCFERVGKSIGNLGDLGERKVGVEVLSAIAGIKKELMM